MLRDMGVGTSRHEDDQLPCRRSRSELDPPTTTARGLLGCMGEKACGLGKQVKPTPGRLRRPVPVCVVELESAWICDEEE